MYTMARPQHALTLRSKGQGLRVVKFAASMVVHVGMTALFSSFIALMIVNLMAWFSVNGDFSSDVVAL